MVLAPLDLLAPMSSRRRLFACRAGHRLCPRGRWNLNFRICFVVQLQQRLRTDRYGADKRAVVRQQHIERRRARERDQIDRQDLNALAVI